MSGRNLRRLAGGLLVAAVASVGPVLAGCDDPVPTNCPQPRPPCTGCETSGSTLRAAPADRRGGSWRSYGRGRAWLLLALRNVAGAVKGV